MWSNIYIYIYIHTQGSPVEIMTPNTLESDGVKLDRPAACVIAQQYSSAMYVRIRFHSNKQKLGARF